MKNKFAYTVPALILFLTACSIQKKNVIKVYAYSQAIIPGIIPAGIDENGNKIRNEYAPKKNYLIYTENLKKNPVTITEIWIDTLHYTVKTEKVSATPVQKLRYNEYNRTDTVLLVPATSNTVMLVLPDKLSEKKISDAGKSGLTHDSGLTVGFLYKEKKYYTRVKEFKVLPPDITQ